MNGGYLTVDGYWIRVFSFLKRAQQISGQISFGDQHSRSKFRACHVALINHEIG